MRRTPRIIVAALLAIAALAASGCTDVYDDYSISGPLKAATLYVNGVDASSATAPTLTVLPGKTVSIDLSRTKLVGAIGPKTSPDSYPVGETRTKCLAKAEWEIVGADKVALAKPFAGSKVFPLTSKANGNECASGSGNVWIDVVIPKDVTGATLSITVFSATCKDASCASSSASAKRLPGTARSGLVPRPRTTPRYVDKERWIAGTVTLKLIDGTPAPAPPAAPRATGLYFTVNPGATDPSRDIARAALDGSAVTPAFVDAGADATSIAVRGAYVYWSTDTAIGRAKLDGTAVQPGFISGLTGVTDIAVTDQYVFWIRNSPTSAIGRADIGGTNVNATWYAPADLNFPTMQYLAANSTHVYMAPTSFGGSAYFRRVAVANPADVTTLAGGVGATEGDFAVDDTYLYATGAYAGGGGGEGIGRMALATAATVGLSAFVNAWPQYEAHWGVAVDGQYIYWVSRKFGTEDRYIGRANIDGTQANATWLPLSIIPNGLAVSSATSRRGAAAAVQPVADRASSSTATMRLAKATVLRFPRLVGYEYRNELLRGRYTFTTSAKSRQVGLGAFTRGTYAQRIDRIGLVPSASGDTTTASGTGTMLMRGRNGALLCVAIDANPVASTYTFTGGRGAGATITGGLQSSPLGFAGTQTEAFGLKTVNGRVTQTRDIVKRGTLTAATGAPRRLSAACRSLIPYLDRRPAGGSIPSVTG
jgi:hypothetical protein